MVRGPDHACARAGVPRTGLGRISGTAIIAGYLAFVTALLITVAQESVRPATAVFSAAVIAAAGALLLTWPRRAAAAGPGGLWQRESVLPGCSIGRLWRLSLISRHRYPVRVPGCRRGRRDDRHRRRGRPPAPAPLMAAGIS